MAGAASADTIPADPQVAAAQALLRNDRLYRGKINGTADTETEAAIRRFQMTYGLRATGRLDEPTVTAMGLPRTLSVVFAPISILSAWETKTDH